MRYLSQIDRVMHHGKRGINDFIGSERPAIVCMIKKSFKDDCTIENIYSGLRKAKTLRSRVLIQISMWTLEDDGIVQEKDIMEWIDDVDTISNIISVKSGYKYEPHYRLSPTGEILSRILTMVVLPQHPEWKWKITGMSHPLEILGSKKFHLNDFSMAVQRKIQEIYNSLTNVHLKENILNAHWNKNKADRWVDKSKGPETSYRRSLKRLMNRSFSVFGSKEIANNWLSLSHPALLNKSPMDHASDRLGIKDATDLLAHYAVSPNLIFW